jgi:hypothetical protein
MEETYANIRDILGHLVGKRIVDITQHDKEDFEADGRSFVCLMFDDGNTATFYVGEEGFSHSEDSEGESRG